MVTKVIPHTRPQEFYAKLRHIKTREIKRIQLVTVPDNAYAQLVNYCRFELELGLNWQIEEWGNV